MKNKVFVVLIIVLAIIIGVAGGYLYYKYSDIFEENVEEEIIEEQPIVVEQKTVQIYKGNDRPIAVMIDNNKSAMPHAGLNEAYMIYEIIVEGGESRLMALFKGANLEKIGPIRSSRHYFLDFALENDAIYVHYGWSPQAESDIKSMGINNLNGITESSTNFWRVKDKVSPHNAVTSTNNILAMANEKGYRTTSNVDSVLKYSVDEIEIEDGEKADEITIPFSNSNTARWVYDAGVGKYLRYSKNKQEVDWDTGEEYKAKNIIIEFIENTDLIDGENKDRQTMTTTGTKKGYYITNGRAEKIYCTKASRGSKTEYTDINGNVLKVNDGNTFVEICPIDADVKIIGNEVSEEVEE